MLARLGRGTTHVFEDPREATRPDTENEGSGPKPALCGGQVGKSRAPGDVSRKAAFIWRTVADGPRF